MCKYVLTIETRRKEDCHGWHGPFGSSRIVIETESVYSDSITLLRMLKGNIEHAVWGHSATATIQTVEVNCG